MNPADRKLVEFMKRHESFFTTMAPEFASEFYAVVREQALSDAADYITRIGTEYYGKIRVSNLGLAKRVREIIYGISGQVRSQGRSGDDLVNEMVRAMRSEEPTVKVEVPLIRAKLDLDKGTYKLLDEEDGDPA